MLNLRRLEYFVAVAEELHFGRAAERLGIAQPPLSQQIQKLEAELGATLFDRSRRSVTLSDAGAALLPEARRLLELAGRVAGTPRRVQAGKAGRLRLGFTGSAAYRLVPALLRHYRESYPDVELDLTEIPTADQLDRIADGTLDAGLVRPPVLRDTVQTAIVWSEPFVVALPSDHQLAQQETIDIGDLRGDPFVIFPRQRGPGLYETIMRMCETHGFVPQIAQEAVQMQTIVGLVGAGFGVSIVPASVRDFRLHGVVYLPLEREPSRSTVALVWNPEARSAVRDRFIEMATRHTITDFEASTG